DSVFIEDTAIVLDEIAVLASMGVESRRAEPAGIEPVLKEYRQVHRLEPGATLEGGDVLEVGQNVFGGLSGGANSGGVTGVEAVDLSEFAKADGGITCLSILVED